MCVEGFEDENEDVDWERDKGRHGLSSSESACSDVYDPTYLPSRTITNNVQRQFASWIDCSAGTTTDANCSFMVACSACSQGGAMAAGGTSGAAAEKTRVAL
jgi:hypothetical protein